MYQFSPPCLETTLDLDVHGIGVTGQTKRERRGRTEYIFECRLATASSTCPTCACPGKPRGTTSRMLIHSPLATHPTGLLLRLRQYTCTGCGRYWREQPGSLLPHPASKLTAGAVTWSLAAVVLDSMSIHAVSRNLGAAWNTVNTAVLQAGYKHLISDSHRFDGVSVIGVDEHCWRHKGPWTSRYVTVIIDLTPRSSGGPARLLDMVDGRSKEVFKTWLATQTEAFRRNVKVVAMDGFTGYKTAAVEALGPVATVMDPFHVVHLAGDKLNACRQRIQQETLGRRGRSGDLLYKARRLLTTRKALLSERGWRVVHDVITTPTYKPIFKIWGVYQNIIQAYQDPDRVAGRARLATIIDALDGQNTAGIPELRTLAKTLKKRRADILAYFTHPGSSNGPTEAINGRLEHLRGIALGFRNLEHYIQRSLLHTGGFRTKIHSLL